MGKYILDYSVDRFLSLIWVPITWSVDFMQQTQFSSFEVRYWYVGPFLFWLEFVIDRPKHKLLHKTVSNLPIK